MRFYEPGIGRFIARDMLAEAIVLGKTPPAEVMQKGIQSDRLAAGAAWLRATMGRSTSLYAGIDNDPVNMLDPTGLMPVKKFLSLFNKAHAAAKDCGEPRYGRIADAEFKKKYGKGQTLKDMIAEMKKGVDEAKAALKKAPPGQQKQRIKEGVDTVETFLNAAELATIVASGDPSASEQARALARTLGFAAKIPVVKRVPVLGTVLGAYETAVDGIADALENINEKIAEGNVFCMEVCSTPAHPGASFGGRGVK